MLEKAPNIVVVCATLLIIAAMTAVTVLIALGRSSSELEHLITTILNGLGVIAGTGAFLYAGASARTSHNVEKELNGNLDERVAKSVHAALVLHETLGHGGNNGPTT